MGAIISSWSQPAVIVTIAARRSQDQPTRVTIIEKHIKAESSILEMFISRSRTESRLMPVAVTCWSMSCTSKHLRAVLAWPWISVRLTRGPWRGGVGWQTLAQSAGPRHLQCFRSGPITYETLDLLQVHWGIPCCLGRNLSSAYRLDLDASPCNSRTLAVHRAELNRN